MPIIFYNTAWMAYNIFLALIPVLFGWLFLRARNSYSKFLTGIIWLLFLPNTIYIFTDLIHIIEQWGKVTYDARLFLPVQYTILEVVGFISFILAFYPFETFLRQSKWQRIRKISTLLSIVLNFLIGFAIVLGRVERINSWEVLTASKKVMLASLHIFQSFELTFLVLLFGLFANFSYFLFRDPIIKRFSWFVRRLR
jgi:uncharacterized membrane protein